MPNKTIYLKEEDLEKWDSLENKSEFIHQALTKGTDSETNPKKQIPLTNEKKLYTPGIKICQHGYAVGLCKFNCKK